MSGGGNGKAVGSREKAVERQRKVEERQWEVEKRQWKGSGSSRKGSRKTVVGRGKAVSHGHARSTADGQSRQREAAPTGFFAAVKCCSKRGRGEGRLFSSTCHREIAAVQFSCASLVHPVRVCLCIPSSPRESAARGGTGNGCLTSNASRVQPFSDPRRRQNAVQNATCMSKCIIDECIQ